MLVATVLPTTAVCGIMEVVVLVVRLVVMVVDELVEVVTVIPELSVTVRICDQTQLS